MRLIAISGPTLAEAGNIEVSFKMEEFTDEIPPYAILSHRWGDQEVTLQDMQGGRAVSKKGFSKIRDCCEMARQRGLRYAWVDTCCIDQTNMAELSESINSMYRWYQRAEDCYAYLADVQSESDFSNSQWFTRGWTLQELIAPPTLSFFNQRWEELGTKEYLSQLVSDRTGIPVSILKGDNDLETASIAQIMSWAAGRLTTKVEDRGYSLLGIFGISMPLIYGEGEMAFIRLQEEIMKISDDHSIFAWKSNGQNHGGLLATSPDAFKESADIVLRRDSSITSKGPLGRQ